MKVIKSKLTDLLLIEPRIFKDNRGFFMETYSQRSFLKHEISTQFVQDNYSMSFKKGVVRGLHFQLPPETQAKLVRVTHGAVYDVAIDLRKNSPTFGMWEGFELSADNFCMLFIPKGFAHGFCTLEDNTEFMYKNDRFYAPELERTIRWDDPTLKISWPVDNPTLSEKDKNSPFLKDIELPF